MTTSPAPVSTDALIAEYDGVICDLDGVVYRGPEAVPGAVETLRVVTRAGVGVVFATNNASRPPEDVADHLVGLGLDRDGWRVATSSQAAAAVLADRLAAGEPVLAVGGPGVAAALREAGLLPVSVAERGERRVAAIVQGLGVDVSWRELEEVAFLTRAGVPWVATNLDAHLPTARGPAPGNGALVAAVRTATSARPEVVGKPAPGLFELGRRELGTHRARTLVVGDRLDTDIAGANAAGLDSLLVLTGASTLADLAEAPPDHLPTYVAEDLRGLLVRGTRP